MENFIEDDDGHFHDGDDCVDEIGWKVSIKHCNLSLRRAAHRIAVETMQLEHGAQDYEYDLSEKQKKGGITNTELLNLRHFAFCLLRKADPTSIHCSGLKVEYRHTDYPSGSTDWVVMFSLPGPGNREFEFHFSSGFQVL